MRRLWITSVTVSALMMMSCTRNVPEPRNAAPGTPHVSWVIMSGDRENPDQDFVCQSDPKTDCVMHVSRPSARVFSDVHLYFHGAGDETRYEGTAAIGFFEDSSAPHVSRTSITVRKNESITNQTTTGIVTSTPGVYTVTLDLTATMTGGGKREPVHQTFQVRVE